MSDHFFLTLFSERRLLSTVSALHMYVPVPRFNIKNLLLRHPAVGVTTLHRDDASKKVSLSIFITPCVCVQCAALPCSHVMDSSLHDVSEDIGPRVQLSVCD